MTIYFGPRTVKHIIWDISINIYNKKEVYYYFPHLTKEESRAQRYSVTTPR